MNFTLHPDFAGSTRRVIAYDLCDVLLEDDSRFVWLILVPRRDGVREIEDLSAADRAQLTEEYILAGSLVRRIGEALGRPIDKLNVAALGNVTPQLHVHVIGRRRDDAAWPKPVWGSGAPKPYSDRQLKKIRAVLR